MGNKEPYSISLAQWNKAIKQLEALTFRVQWLETLVALDHYYKTLRCGTYQQDLPKDVRRAIENISKQVI